MLASLPQPLSNLLSTSTLCAEQTVKISTQAAAIESK